MTHTNSFDAILKFSTICIFQSENNLFSHKILNILDHVKMYNHPHLDSDEDKYSL